MMSYCRWSCDNFKSDIYCYEHVDGYFAIHVAGNRSTATNPNDPEPSMDDFKVWADWAERNRVPIGLAHDGEDFSEADEQDCLDRLLYLRRAGYHVPEHALERLREEIASTPQEDPA